MFPMRVVLLTRTLGVKKFVGKFCSGQINHIGIRTLQLFLAKVALILGVR